MENQNEDINEKKQINHSFTYWPSKIVSNLFKNLNYSSQINSNESNQLNNINTINENEKILEQETVFLFEEDSKEYLKEDNTELKKTTISNNSNLQILNENYKNNNSNIINNLSPNAISNPLNSFQFPISPRKKEEPKGALQIIFTTIFNEKGSFILDSTLGDPHTSIIECLQKETYLTDLNNDQLIEQEQKKTSSSPIQNRLQIKQMETPSSTRLMKSTTPMIKELSISATPPFDFVLRQLPIELCSLLTLQKLSIERNELSFINSNISRLLALNYLYLCYNHLKTLPMEIKTLTNLTYLNVSSNYLVSFPNITSLTNLKYLIVHKNQLTSLPNLDKCLSLEELIVHNNKINILHSSLLSLTSLKILDFSYNQINSLMMDKKGEIWNNLTNLTFLNLKSNKISNLTNSIGCLSQLLELDISFNQLSQIPKEISNLIKLEKLDLSNNLLNLLPEEIIQLASLKTLFLQHNKLISIPSFQKNSLLTELNLSFNMINSLPLSSFSSSIKILDLSYNKLTNIPSEISLLINLIKLNLSHNNMNSFPIEIFPSKNSSNVGLISLKCLNISHNQFKNLPSEIGTLTQLIELDISENTITSVPIEVKDLVNLEILSLHSTKVQVLPHELPQSLNQLSLANILINKKKKEIQTISNNSTLIQQLPILLSYARSTPHPLIIYALSYFSEKEKYKDILIQNGALSDFFQFCRINNLEIVLQSMKALGNLYENYIPQSYLDENGINTIFEILMSKQYNAQIREQAILCLGNICLNEASRKLIINKFGIEPFIKIYQHEDYQISIIKKALNKLLNILGAHEFLHFPKTIDFERTNGIRILAMDGGGTKALTTLELLKKIEELTGKRIPEIFDIICGTSTGAILACLVGIRGYSLDKCEALYKDLSSKVFMIGTTSSTSINSIDSINIKKTSSDPSAWAKLINYTYLLKSGAFYKVKPLLHALSAYCGIEPMIDSTMEENVKSTKVFFVSTVVSQTPPSPYIFRNYNYPINSKSRYDGDYKTKIFHALRASTAAPSYFEEYETPTEKHQDGGIVANNPTAIAIHEAFSLWPNRHIECVVSLGTGTPPPRPLKNKGIHGLLTTLIKAVTSSERVHNILSDLLPRQNIHYFRFNPIDEIFQCELDETDEEKLKQFQEAAREYIKNQEEDFIKLCKILKEPLNKGKIS